MQQKQEYEAQMALSGIGKPSTSTTMPKPKNIQGSQINAMKRDKVIPNRPTSSNSQNSQNIPVQSPLPKPITYLKGQRLSQDSDKSDVSQQSSESDRIILESNDDEDDDEDEDDNRTTKDKQCEVEDSKHTTEQSDKSTSKNIEIRRMSSTDEGDKVLQSAWASPEKDEAGKTPLEMVQNIVSSIDSPSDNDKLEENTDEMTVTQKNKELAKNQFLEQDSSSSNPIPSWVQGSGKPLMHSQHIVANQTAPSSHLSPLLQPIPQPPVPTASQTNATIPIVSQSGAPVIFGPAPNQQQPMAPVQMTAAVGQPQVPTSQPPIMQIVNTVNGPMLMQAFPAPTGIANVNTNPADQSNTPVIPQRNTLVLPTTNGVYQASQSTTVTNMPPKKQQETLNNPKQQDDDSDKDEEEDDHRMVLKKTKKGKKKKNDSSSSSHQRKDSPNQNFQYQSQIPVSQQNQMPVLVANASQPGLIGASPSPQALQPLIMNQPGAVLTNVGGQVLLSNGSFMAVPAIYNQQMPDGSIVQVQNGMTQIPSAPIIQQSAQPMITGNGAGPIMMTPQGSGHFIPSAGTFIMTPQGLVPATPAGLPPNNPSHPGNFVAIAPAGTPNQQLQQVTISPANTPTLVQQQPTPPPTQVPQQQQQQILAIQQQQSVPSTSLTIQLDDDDSDDNSVSMSPPSARSTPIPRKNKQKSFKRKKRLKKDSRNSSKSKRAQEQAIEYHEVDDEDDVEDIKPEDNELEKIEYDDDSDVEEIVEDHVVDDDDISDDDDESPTERLSAQSSPIPNSSKSSLHTAKSSTNRASQKRSKSKHGSKIFIQSNKVDSSGRKATPPHSADDKLSSSELFNASSNPDDSLDTSGMSNSSSNSIGNIDVNEPSSSRGPSRKRRYHKNVSSSSQKKRKRNEDAKLQEKELHDDSDGMSNRV